MADQGVDETNHQVGDSERGHHHGVCCYYVDRRDAGLAESPERRRRPVGDCWRSRRSGGHSRSTMGQSCATSERSRTTASCESVDRAGLPAPSRGDPNIVGALAVPKGMAELATLKQVPADEARAVDLGEALFGCASAVPLFLTLNTNLSWQSSND